MCPVSMGYPTFLPSTDPVFLPGSITTKPFQHGTLGCPGFPATFPRGSGVIQGESHKSIIPVGKNSIFFQPTTLQAGKGRLWPPAPCGAIREWDRDTSPSNLLPGGKRVFHPQRIPSAHGRVTKLPGKKKFGFAFNPLPPQGLFQQNFPVLVDLGTNPSPGCGRDGGEPQGRGENPPEIHGNGVFGIQSCIS